MTVLFLRRVRYDYIVTGPDIDHARRGSGATRTCGSPIREKGPGGTTKRRPPKGR
jgi:hypothetical protein